MTVIVTDAGFGPDTWTAGFEDAAALDLTSDADPAALTDSIGAVQIIRIDFPSFADGRGFTLARQLRLMGYQGRLRAKGHVLADQYAMARRTGFDEVEISDDLAARQPQEQWLARAQWKAHNYQARLRGSAAAN
ncbi:hypothetical protein PH5382_00205 [Phaeobacter sp. CECT 5382]|uniref:DUF934 domain-containing protein n=1 Tax=Rhodobacterales TaxID=204455 RepID=UPI0006DB9370|nr:DUF934 domain-containing protein [Phaeobacter sp. CECT 5382]CUH86296.1 hypothetical protein PH5382_00205 [Phaeobacter sp. CECT 5382]